MKHIFRINNKGVSLVEILVATLIIVPVLMALLQIYISNVYLSELTREKMMALDNLKSMIETIKSTPFNNIPTKFPNGIIDGLATNNYANIVGGYHLKDEHITVTYVNPSEDPLEILVTVDWQDMRGRQSTYGLTTMRTR